jgi:hypothetical protein
MAPIVQAGSVFKFRQFAGSAIFGAAVFAALRGHAYFSAETSVFKSGRIEPKNEPDPGV